MSAPSRWGREGTQPRASGEVAPASCRGDGLEALPDPALLLAIAAGDRKALGDLYDRHARDVWRVLVRTTNDSPDVEDLVHATFLKLPALAGSYDGRPCCRPWLAGIAVRLALVHQRGLGRLRRVLLAFAGAVGGVSCSSPERAAEAREEVAVCKRALARLSDKKRAVFVLVELDGYPLEVVATQLGIPLATVRTRLFHARRDLREALATAHDRGREEPSGAATALEGGGVE